MLCLNCKSESFSERTAPVKQLFRGEELEVNAACLVCNDCGWVTMTNAQADCLRTLTADEHRRRHGLLTGAEILAHRDRLGMSQVEFADFLKLGVASIKRWENGSVQEQVYDKHIREACAPNILFELHSSALELAHWSNAFQHLHNITISAKLEPWPPVATDSFLLFATWKGLADVGGRAGMPLVVATLASLNPQWKVLRTEPPIDRGHTRTDRNDDILSIAA